MNILQTVVVKQILTEKSKAELLNKYNKSKLQLIKECEQLRFEAKKQEKSNRFPHLSVKNQYDREIDTRLEKLKLLQFQIEQLHILSLGSELKEKEIQAIVEVNVGDLWEDISANKTIIIEDGIVTEIR